MHTYVVLSMHSWMFLSSVVLSLPLFLFLSNFQYTMSSKILFIRMCMYVCICVHESISMNVYRHIFMCAYVCMHPCMCVYIYVSCSIHTLWPHQHKCPIWTHYYWRKGHWYWNTEWQEIVNLKQSWGVIFGRLYVLVVP